MGSLGGTGSVSPKAPALSREEAQRRTKDTEHPWFGRWLRRAKTHTALNALIQGSAARHTKLWMRACWREGIVPLLQMHDALECSVTTREQGELVARLGCEAVRLEVPMRVDLKFGRSWGDAKHTWDELTEAAPKPVSVPESEYQSELASTPKPEPKSQSSEPPAGQPANDPQTHTSPEKPQQPPPRPPKDRPANKKAPLNFELTKFTKIRRAAHQAYFAGARRHADE